MCKIYQPLGRARKYSPLALNYFKGCTHGCIYCYVPRMLTRWNPGYDHSKVTADIDWNELRNSAAKYWDCDKQILLSFTGDPYCDFDPSVTRQVLRILNDYGHKVAILTKGGMRCLRDLDMFRLYGDRIKVGATLTFDNDRDSMEWEPGAASPSERIEALRTLAEAGIRTWVSFEPVIVPEQSLHLLEQVAPFIDHVKIGKVNQFRDYDRRIDWQAFIRDAVAICREKAVPFYIKEDLRRYNSTVPLTSEECDPDHLNL